MKLSRRVPARTKTIVVEKLARDFFTMSQTFRDIRGNSRNPMDCCYWCKRPFADGESMSLGIMQSGPNRVFCSKCADELEESEVK